MASQNPMQDSELILKKECEDSWKQVNKNQAVWVAQPRHEAVGRSEDALANISQMQARCLQGEIDAVKAKPVQVLPNDPVILEALLKEDLEKNVSQLEECLSVVEGRRRELEDDLARQKELLSQHQEMNRALEARLREAEEGGNKSRPTEDSQVKLIKRKQKKAGEIQNKLLKQIGDFVGTHFPLPDAQRNNQASQIKYISLLEIIELLMNKGMDGDTDPYISIHEAFWPPYVELLLRCDIASRHPQDTSRIRLVPLHI